MFSRNVTVSGKLGLLLLLLLKAVTYLIRTGYYVMSFSGWKFPEISITVKREDVDGVAVEINSTFS